MIRRTVFLALLQSFASVLAVMLVCLLTAHAAKVRGESSHYSTPALKSNDVMPDEHSSHIQRMCHLSKLWHNAGIADVRGDFESARIIYDSMLKYCAAIRARSEQKHPMWYEAMADYGIARMSARLHDTAAVRPAIVAAFEAELWNFDLVQLDPSLVHIAGSQWTDSLVEHYRKVRDESIPQWKEQDARVVIPRQTSFSELPDTALHHTGMSRRFFRLDSLKTQLGGNATHNHRPLIIALHGGNASYKEFASHWFRVADSLDAYILIPAGPVRFGPHMNSWDANYATDDLFISSLIDRFAAQCGYDPEVFLTGFSQGAMTAIEYGLVHSDRVRGVISIAGFLNGPLPKEVIESGAQNGLKIYAMSGEFDSPAFRASLDRARTDCTRVGLPFQFESVSGIGHEVPGHLVSLFSKAFEWIHSNNPPKAVIPSLPFGG
jgi:predicted esterase